MRRIALLRGGPLDGLQWDWNDTKVPDVIRAVYRNISWDESDRKPFDPTNDPHLHYGKEPGSYYSLSGAEEVHVFFYGKREDETNPSGDIHSPSPHFWLHQE